MTTETREFSVRMSVKQIITPKITIVLTKTPIYIGLWHCFTNIYGETYL